MLYTFINLTNPEIPSIIINPGSCPVPLEGLVKIAIGNLNLDLSIGNSIDNGIESVNL